MIFIGSEMDVGGSIIMPIAINTADLQAIERDNAMRLLPTLKV